MQNLRTTQAVATVEALVAGAVADGDVAADVAEGGVAHHFGELLVERAHRSEGGGGEHFQWLGREVLAIAVVAVSIAMVVTVRVAVARCGWSRSRLRDGVEGRRVE